MPVNPSPLERKLIRSNEFPVPWVDGFLYWVAGKAVLVASKLGLFDALEKGPQSVSDLAREIKASENGVGVLLKVLECLGYVRSRGKRYTNTAMSSRWLVSSSPQSLVASMAFIDGFWERTSSLEETIRNGKPSVPVWQWMEQHPGSYLIAQTHWKGSARLMGPEVISNVQVPSRARRLLDLGGGHGLYAIQFCRANPQLSAVVYDWPGGVEAAKESIGEEGMAGRVTTRVGDYNRDDIGSNYDVVFMSNIIHAWSAEDNTFLLKKVFQALNPAGIVVILDGTLGKGKPKGMSGALASMLGLNLLVEVGGQTYSFEEVSAWLGKLGFHEHHLINMTSVPGFALILGTKPTS